jgi:hypothetical protein
VENVRASPVAVLAVDTWAPGTPIGQAAMELPEWPSIFDEVGGDCAYAEPESIVMAAAAARTNQFM